MGKIKKTKTSKKSSNLDQSFSKKDKVKKVAKKISTPISRISKKIISKKEKLKIKKQKVLDGIKNTKIKFAEEKARKKREKTAIIGDLRPLLDSLPSLDELMTIRDNSKAAKSPHQQKAQRKPKNKFEKKKIMIHEKTEKFLDRFDHMQKLWKDPEFQNNPRQMLAERIRRSRNENEMDS
ncbi:ribosome biogenesis protein SLX9 homolog [Chironomus tepperi]|uniref:ribosome biogenesis protein SLX9 homolog n=1 Tax=Chironomus tepperi TaxID=113505 RepID=UPI00391F100C